MRIKRGNHRVYILWRYKRPRRIMDQDFEIIL